MPVYPWLFIGALLTTPMAIAAETPSQQLDIRSPRGDVLITAAQIHDYDWETHTLTLAPKAREELARRLWKDKADKIVSGVPFVLAIDGKPIYEGAITSILSSRSFSTPMIVVDASSIEAGLAEDQLRIQLGYPTAEFYRGADPRGNERIRQALVAADKLAVSRVKHAEWLARSLREMQAIKPGQTRGELLKVLEEEGGLSTRSARRYAYRGCPLIKVDVKFEPVGKAGDKLSESPDDRIRDISKPFLEWPIAD